MAAQYGTRDLFDSNQFEVLMGDLRRVLWSGLPSGGKFYLNQIKSVGPVSSAAGKLSFGYRAVCKKETPRLPREVPPSIIFTLWTHYTLSIISYTSSPGMTARPPQVP